MIAPEHDPAPNSPSSSTCEFRDAIWKGFFADFGSVLVVGHGTRNKIGAKQLHDLVQQMRTKVPEAIILGCFLELAEPSIEMAMEQLQRRGTKKTLVVPVLLFTAAHALHDIPDAVSQAAKRYGIEVVGQTTSLGTHPFVVGLSQARFAEVNALGEGQCCPENACAKVRCSADKCEGQSINLGRIGLAMVGRGTSDQLALSHMRQLTALKVAGLSTVRYQTGFFAGGIPNVDELLNEAADWDCDTVVVQPHLLFEGELMEQLRNKVLQCQLRFPVKQWLIARTLGADPMLADVFLDLACQQLER